MGKFLTIIRKAFAILSKSITIENAKKAVDELDRNHDGKLSVYDLVLLIIAKATEEEKEEKAK